MPRRQPQRVRAALRARGGSHNPPPLIDGVPARVLTEIPRLEDTRNQLRPGEVATAGRLWRDFVRQPARGQWHAYEFGNDHSFCCDDPVAARLLLDSVLHALSRCGARELRGVVGRPDALWIPPWQGVSRRRA